MELILAEVMASYLLASDQVLLLAQTEVSILEGSV